MRNTSRSIIRCSTLVSIANIDDELRANKIITYNQRNGLGGLSKSAFQQRRLNDAKQNRDTKSRFNEGTLQSLARHRQSNFGIAWHHGVIFLFQSKK